MNTTTANPATDKQVRFILTLLAELDSPAPTEDELRSLGKAMASNVIDDLLARRREVRSAKHAEAAGDVPEGIHALDQADGTIEVRKVQVAKNGSGRKYGKVLDASSGRWDYAGQRGLAGLSDDTLMTREQAERFGALYGMCGVCGATLTDEDSIARGIGPVCATRVR